ncbi:MAG: zinc protease [Gammaproteobacteria bacterium]|nr:zinc protease [Gammaproteobacteria bacterium]
MTLSLSLFSAMSLTAHAASSSSSGNGQVLDIQYWKTTQSAVPVYFVRTPELPMVDFDIVFDAGSARDGEKFGVAQLTASFLDEGAGKWDADQIAERFDDVGAVYSVSVTQDMAAIGFRSLTEKDKLEQTLETFTTIITDPKFPQDPFKRLQKQTLVALEQIRQSPTALAKKAFAETLYGKQHPYGHLSIGTQKTAAALTRDDAQAFYKTYYIAQNARILMVGDLTREAAEVMAEKIVAALPQGTAPKPLAQTKPRKSAATRKNIDFPAQQTAILMGQLGIRGDDPDLFPLMVGNHILGGGGLVSRLFDEVREQRGLVYGISSKFSPLAAKGPFFIFLQTRKEEAENAIDLTQRILKDFVSKGPSQKELDAAKKNIIGSFPLQISSNSDILEQLLFISSYNLPLDFLNNYRKNVEKVTADQMREAFQKHIKPDEMTIITVGEQQQGL